ncbi:hypothetical protein RMSM_04282 [Rhodopirellula maiorica SM1]|uniref:Uncharacterized protein n=1 Tax=Rhodopirellula maiorica SM1 TaxID=1265738 RepID=M5RTW0_9BACT|nr:hypothetical protein RMSM_04282 [Rhodopirellula maiorica SM1]
MEFRPEMDDVVNGFAQKFGLSRTFGCGQIEAWRFRSLWFGQKNSCDRNEKAPRRQNHFLFIPQHAVTAA